MNAATHSLDQLIQASLTTASAHRRRLTRLHVRCTIAGMLLGAMATFFAGLSSLTNRPLVNDDWRVTCTIAAALTLLGTVVGGAQSLLARPDQLSQASECIGKLRAMLADATSALPNWDEVRKKYQQLLIDYADIEL
jgi:hypothetical protein